jgi:RNA polymerase sigma factor (TIGR02999 family)
MTRDRYTSPPTASAEDAGALTVSEDSRSKVTRLLVQLEQGDRQAANDLLPLVYEELRKLASARMARERPGQTLQATALVHEAYLRLVGEDDPRWENRAHFFGAAAEAMRRILIERARRRGRVRHGGDQVKVTLAESVADAGSDTAIDVILVDQALTRLEGLDAEMARVVKLRYFAGLEIEEVAAAIGSSPRSVNRLWTAARAWLQRELASATPTD